MAEELTKELKDSIIESDIYGQMIHHPLIVSPYVLPSVENPSDKERKLIDQQIEILNKGFKDKQAILIRSIDAKKWNQVLTLHERPYRLQTFLQFAPFMKPVEYWQNLAWIWTDTEFPFSNKEMWIDLFTANVKQKRKLMTSKERRTLQNLPEKVTIYRGYDDKGELSGPLGISWTLLEEKAEWFAKRFGVYEDSSPAIAVGTCNRKAILAYFNGRGEEEIVVNPLDVNIIDNKDVYVEVLDGNQ